MLYHFFDTIGRGAPGAGLFDFISFRAAMAVFVSLLISLWWGKGIINLLRRSQVGETVRDLGLEGQMEKQGTPTMGGLMILAAAVFSVLLWCNLSNGYVWVVLFVTVTFGSPALILVKRTVASAPSPIALSGAVVSTRAKSTWSLLKLTWASFR